MHDWLNIGFTTVFLYTVFVLQVLYTRHYSSLIREYSRLLYIGRVEEQRFLKQL
jgi:hypothetical protein